MAAKVQIALSGTSAGSMRGAILEVNGVLYGSAPDNAWAIDAHDGHELWHYFWKTKGGTHIGNRGLGMYGNWLYMETPDDYLVCLDAATGKERWHKVISDFSEQYFSTMAPIVIGNHVLVGTGDDLDAPGFLQSFDPETGDLQWKFYTTPQKAGRSRSGYLDRASMRRSTAAARSGYLAPTIPIRISTSSAPAIPLPPTLTDPRRRRQSIHRLSRCCQCRYRQDGLVLSNFTA